MTESTKSLAVLIVEDVESDAQFIVRQLKKAGYELIHEQVETAEQMRAALKKQGWDVIISDYQMPQFDGLSALRLLREAGFDIPFIVVSGTIGEETAVSMMKAGAHDYLIKGNLARLIPAVEREINQARIRREQRKLEDARATSEAELRALVEQVPAIVYTESAETRQTTYISPQLERVTGYTASEWIEDTSLWKTIVHPDDVAAVVQTDNQTTQTHEPFLAEYRILTRDGRIIWIHDEAVVIKGRDGNPLFWQGVMYDITARKESEELLREQSEQIRLLYEASQKLNRTLDLIEIYQTVSDFMSAIASNDCLIISSFDAETQLIHCRAYRINSEWMDAGALPPIPLEEEGRGTQSAVIRTGQPLMLNDYLPQQKTARTSYYVEDETHQLVTETPPDAEVPRSALLVPLKVGDRVTGVIQLMSYRLNAYTENQLKLLESLSLHIASAEQNALLYARVQKELNERRQAEESLRLSEERYRELFDRMIDGFALHEIICDENGRPVDYRFLEVNPAFERLTGVSAANLIGKTALEALPDSERDWIKVYGDVALTGRSVFYENHHRELDRYFEVSVYCPRQGQFALILEDITERKRAEEDIRHRVSELEMLYQSGLALSQLLHPREIGRNLTELLGQKLNWHHTAICAYNPQDDSLKLLDFSQPGLEDDAEKLALEEIFNKTISRSSDGLTGWALRQSMTIRSGDVTSEPHYIETYPDIRSGLYVPMKLGSRKIGVIGVESEQPDAFSEEDERLLATLASQAASALENARLFEEARQRVTELEMLYQSGLALSQLLTPREIGQKILELLEENLGWHHTRIRLYHPHDDSLELLDFNQPGLNGDLEHQRIVQRFQSLIANSNQGLSGWVIQHGETVRSADVPSDPRYVAAYPGIRSGLYVPMKLGQQVIGVISIESEQSNAFSETDEKLIDTLATQAASAFENARLFEVTRQRVMELETLNRISLVLRAVTKQHDILSIVLDEALAILNTSHGYIQLHNKTTNNLDKVVSRGWAGQINEPPQNIHEGIAGRVFSRGEIYVSREFASEKEIYPPSRGKIPPKWGGACLPIRSSQQTLGIMLVFVPSERELDKDEIRLLSILSEMTGAALQRMQLHEQTVRRLEQLNALRAIDQAISSSLDMNLTLHVLITHTISQLNVDAADVLLLHPDSKLLELVAGRGFRTVLGKNISLNNSFAGRVILERRPTMELTLEAVNQNPKFAQFWKDEGFICSWCAPLIIKGEIKGVLEVYCRKHFTPDAEWLEFLEALAGQAAIAIDNTQLFENLQRANLDLSLAYDATIEGWSRALDLRDHETEGHTLRVTDLTLKLARAMRVGGSQLTAIRRGALLHDIGKMGVPDAILLKEGKLTDEEWTIMRRHPQFARDMLLPINYLNDALDIPYSHHEKWDGTGYPLGLKGDRIPLAARIFAVVDVWDALTNDRPYREKWTNQRARDYILEHSGKHFDPQVVEVFLKSIEED